jgi:uroporphyrinogen decarboxylase
VGLAITLPFRPSAPDFDAFAAVVSGERAPERVHLVELGIDEEVVKVLAEDYLDMEFVPIAGGTTEAFWRSRLRLYAGLGYDFMRLWSFWQGLPDLRSRVGEDTAALSRGQRQWVDESAGVIASWDDFERFPWETMTFDYGQYDLAEKHLPEGMKLMAGTTLFEMVLKYLLGYEGLFLLLHDDPPLVKAVFDAWGQKALEVYRNVIGRESVGGIFHADDLAYKTATMVSPGVLREMVFPWLRQYAQVAHEHGKLFCLHSCGNLREVLPDLMDDVQIDALHSFQDVIFPVAEFKRAYGDRVAALGGVDMDKLARLDEAPLRAYVRGVLDSCMPGRFALGSGNTVANYVPVRNYMAMVEEGIRFG